MNDLWSKKGNKENKRGLGEDGGFGFCIFHIGLKLEHFLGNIMVLFKNIKILIY
jgi:hypothetical protein